MTDNNAKPSEADLKAHASVQEMLDLYRYVSKLTSFVGFDTQLMNDIRLINVSSNGTINWELDMTSSYANINGVMHGGAAGVIFDMATTASLCPVQREGYWDFLGGVTRSLNVSYLRAVPVGSTVRVVSELVQHGRTMAFLRGRMESLDGKTLYASCEHHKVNVPSLGAHLKIRDEMRAEKRRLEKGRDAKL